MNEKQEVVYGYAWEFKEGRKWMLCGWMEHNASRLKSEGIPFPKARMVPVKMMRRGKVKP